ncbi:polysaccharide deacetylase [Paenibacillus sp. FSL F4-0243]|uniref:polysaccharide deacetylase n=1 Tax=Paenibacillus sp. FSL F4-0243 TaxID=2954732 RepID=UPI0030D80A3C
MKGNKSAHSRRKLISGLLVMVVIFIVMLGWSIGKNLNSWELRSLQPASAESVSVKNKLTAATMQDLPSAVEPLASASPEVHSSSSAALTVNQLPQANGVEKISKVSTKSSAITAAKKSKKTVYITFDDGPSDNTFNVLEILHQEGVKATFFVLGNQAKSHPELIDSIWEQGHAIGNHTYNHNYHDLYSGFTEFWNQIKQTEEIVQGITGVRPQLIRAPGGTYDHFDNTYFNLLKQAGYKVMDWTVDSGDSKRKGVPASEILKESTIDMKSSQVILLLHDGGGHQESVKALPDIIARYKAAGYDFGLLDETVEPVQFRVSSKATNLGRKKPSEAWVASNITPNAELFAPGKPLILEVGKLETKLNPGEYSVRNGQYMVPLRAVIERLGGRVSWDVNSRSGEIDWNGKAVIADVMNKQLILNHPDKGQKTIDARVEMIGGSIWVSLRELLETTGHPPLNISVTEVERRVKTF